MIFEFIMMTVVFNSLLGIIALIKSRNRVNISFFSLSLLLAAWNFCVVMYKGYGIEVFDRINFVVVLFIPAAVLNFIMALFGIKKGKLRVLRGIYLGAGFLGAMYVAATFMSAEIYASFHSYSCKVINFLFEGAANIITFIILVKLHSKIKYKMEREKIGYVIIAFSVLLGGGILDFTSSLEWHGLHYTGNISAAVYAFIIFTAVFRHRLFNTGFIFRNFIIYSLFAAVMTAIIIAAAELLLHKIPAFYGIVFIIFITILLYMKKIYLLMQKISLKIGMLTDSEKINAEMIKIKDAEETADTKLRKTAVLLSTGFEMEIFIFVIDGDHYVKWWCTEEKMCPDRVNFQEITAKTVIRYETKKIKDLDAFNADILIPLTQSMTVHGLLAGKKYTADISFLEEEIRVLENGAKIIAELLGSHILHQKKTEEESIKRMGRVAGQMAHEINNPLTALWGAAQLLDGKTGREKENIDIIREEIKRLKKILEQWRVFSDKIFIEKSRVNVNRILKDTVKMVMFDSIWENIELFIDEKDEIEAEIDSDKMRQVFINVLKNSADAAVVSGAGKIEITVEKKDMNAVIKFKDNGAGVEKGIAQRIKQPFFTTKQKGSGLGLAISERIIKGHKGAITISSDSRSYTEVVITLPLSK